MNELKLTNTNVTITAEDRRLIQRSTRLLVAIVEPKLFERARNEGYTTAEHKLGWRLTQVAGGANLSFDGMSAAAQVNQKDTQAKQRQLADLQRIDGFENMWLPRARGILARHVPASHREAFEAAFFAGIEQQPLGPGVVGSVSLFLARLAELSASEDPHAASFREVLRERGLDDDLVAEMSKLVARAQAVAKSGNALDAATIATLLAGNAERAEAVVALRAWFVDWSTTLRSAFNGREQMKLGLVLRGGAKKKGKGEDGE